MSGPPKVRQGAVSGGSLNLEAFGALPDGWEIEQLPCQLHHVMLRTPLGNMVTIDFDKRGIRTGYRITGRFIGEDWNKPRKKYSGRAWKQALFDDAVATLAEIG